MNMIKYPLLAIALNALAGCSSINLVENNSNIDLVNTNKTVFTKVNLHPDENKAKLYSVNYQREGLMPACTKVDLIELEGKRLTFKTVENGKTYTLDKHSSSPDFSLYLKKYFGTQCVKADIAKLSSADKDGIKKGVASVGMTKQGVIYAIGYPPTHRTPSTDSNEWIYWVHRFKTMKVIFDSSGVVSSIRK